MARSEEHASELKQRLEWTDWRKEKEEEWEDRVSCSKVSKKISRWEEGIGGGMERIGEAWKCGTFKWHCKKCATKQSLAVSSFMHVALRLRFSCTSLCFLYACMKGETTITWGFCAPVEVLHYHVRVSACVFGHVCVRFCRINAPLPPAVIHLPPCHFPFRSCLAWGNVPPISPLAPVNSHGI